MTRAEQERLVGRYLSGELGVTEEQEFFIRVAVDNELRQTLKAFRIVDNAIQKHRESAPIQHADSRNNLLIALNLQAATPHYSNNRGPTPGSTVQRQRRFRDTVISPVLFKWMMAAATACSLAIGTFVIAPAIEKPTDETAQTQGSRGSVGTTHAVTGERFTRTVLPNVPQEEASTRENSGDIAAQGNRIEQTAVRSTQAVKAEPTETIRSVDRQTTTPVVATEASVATKTSSSRAPKTTATTTDGAETPQAVSQEHISTLDNVADENDGNAVLSTPRSSSIKLTTPESDTLKFRVKMSLPKIP